MAETRGAKQQHEFDKCIFSAVMPDLTASTEKLNPAPDNVDLRVSVEKSQLMGKAMGLTNIVTVHTSQELALS